MSQGDRESSDAKRKDKKDNRKCRDREVAETESTREGIDASIGGFIARQREQEELSAIERNVESPAKPRYQQSEVVGIAREFRDLREQVEGKTKLPACALLIASPFMPEILAYKAPTEIKLPKHSAYDSTSDPREHL
nr:uncharacterized protein LOC109166912 [Ipomoea trifida]